MEMKDILVAKIKQLIVDLLDIYFNPWDILISVDVFQDNVVELIEFL